MAFALQWLRINMGTQQTENRSKPKKRSLLSQNLFAKYYLFEIDKIIHNNIWDGEEDGPVHQVETGKEDRENHSAVLVDITWLQRSGQEEEIKYF